MTLVYNYKQIGTESEINHSRRHTKYQCKCIGPELLVKANHTGGKIALAPRITAFGLLVIRREFWYAGNTGLPLFIIPDNDMVGSIYF